MLFKKEFLLDLLECPTSVEDTKIINNEIVDHGRWSITNKMIFQHKDKFYVTTYKYGATECQDESPYEYEKDEIECKEVFPVQKTITVYE